MFESLNDFENGEELAYNELYSRFPKKIVEFLTWDFGFLDAPVKVSKGVDLQGRIPSRIDFDLRSTSSSLNKINWEEKEVYGSNAWVVSGARSETGKPLLAGDPHLNITVPNIWYRVELKDSDLSVRGVTVPGIPGVVIGRNPHLAWSFTNSRADVQDFIELGSQFNEDSVPAELQEFLKLTKREEKLQVKGGKEHLIKCWDSAYGPMFEEKLETGLTYKRILQWTALGPMPLSRLNPLDIDQAHQLDELWEALSRWGGPVQNILVATRDNHIAWGIVGKIPDQRKDFGRTSTLIKDRSVWKQYIPWEEMPRVVDPIEGFVASGNQNMWVESTEKSRWGHDWPSPARGFQIRKLLSESSAVSVERMQAIQNEIYSPVHVWYRDRLVDAIRTLESQNKPLTPWVEAILNLVGVWDGRAGIDSASYSLLREFRLTVLKNAMSPFVARTAPYRHEEVMSLIAKDSVVQMLLLNKPFHLLSPQFSSWEELLVISATEAAGQLAKSPKELSKATWGTRNILKVQHPFSSKIPLFAARLINLPERSLAGDGLVVRVSKPKNGASMRMVIDVSNGEHSLFSQPGGQSGYFLSPHYQDLFESWYVGKGGAFESSQIESKQVIHP
jgi:penicillin amidase